MEEEGELLYQGSSDSDKEGGTTDSQKYSKHLFPVEETDELLKAIYITEEIQETQPTDSVRDRL